MGRLYKETDVTTTRLATEQTHFYSMVTAMIAGGLLEKFSADLLIQKLARFANIIEDRDKLAENHPAFLSVKRYREISSRQTTDVSRREERQRDFVTAIESLEILQEQGGQLVLTGAS